eukprot:GILJ01005331.1.p1 GENE.GILJ01005331.1~~GILJ01005331.1.p1  ORF type:complete len:127 (+),score=10.60 GILJ01005331.1:32-412(+)
MNTLVSRVLIGVLCCASLTFLFVACGYYDNWWLLFNLLAVCLVPFPTWMAMTQKDALAIRGDYDAAAIFATAALVTVTFAIPILLVHVHAITVGALCLGLGSVIALYGAVALFYWTDRRENAYSGF